MNNINSEINNDNNDSSNDSDNYDCNTIEKGEYKKYLQLGLPTITIVLENFLSCHWKDAGIITYYCYHNSHCYIIITINHKMLFTPVPLASIRTYYHN